MLVMVWHTLTGTKLKIMKNTKETFTCFKPTDDKDAKKYMQYGS
jgi:hypothetical protein